MKNIEIIFDVYNKVDDIWKRCIKNEGQLISKKNNEKYCGCVIPVLMNCPYLDKLNPIEYHEQTRYKCMKKGDMNENIHR